MVGEVIEVANCHLPFGPAERRVPRRGEALRLAPRAQLVGRLAAHPHAPARRNDRSRVRQQPEDRPVGCQVDARRLTDRPVLERVPFRAVAAVGPNETALVDRRQHGCPRPLVHERHRAGAHRHRRCVHRPAFEGPVEVGDDRGPAGPRRALDLRLPDRERRGLGALEVVGDDPIDEWQHDAVGRRERQPIRRHVVGQRHGGADEARGGEVEDLQLIAGRRWGVEHGEVAAVRRPRDAGEP